MNFRQYIRPATLEEAYMLAQKRSSVILGGGLWLKEQSRTAELAIDLCDLGLNRIEETDTAYRIGAYVTLRQLETHPGINALTQNAVADSVSHIVGVQFRNMATVGGSLFGRFGFSDVLTVCMALGTSVELYRGGEITVEAFSRMPHTRDILTHMILPKSPVSAAFLSQRNAATDFSVCNVAAALREGQLVCAVGARPLRAVAFRDEDNLLADGITEESARRFANSVAQRAVFASNLRAGADYRRLLCRTLVRRAVLTTAENAKENG